MDGKVFFNAPRAETGTFYDVLIDRADEADLYGKVCREPERPMPRA